MAGVNVRSEIMPLKKVLLHRPGKELFEPYPNTLEELLDDDIPFLKVAQEEHDAFAQILRNEGVEVVYLEDLMAEVLDLYPRASREVPEAVHRGGGHSHRSLSEDHLRLPERQLSFQQGSCPEDHGGHQPHRVALDKSNSLVDLVSEASKMVVAPMPNLSRAPFAMIGTGVSINRMYSVTRNRETIYGEYIFKYHPDFSRAPTSTTAARNNTFHIEGGDILNINEHVLAIGISQRTEPDAIDAIAKHIFESDSPDH